VPEPEVEEAVESVDVGGVATGTGDPEYAKEWPKISLGKTGEDTGRRHMSEVTKECVRMRCSPLTGIARRRCLLGG